MALTTFTTYQETQKAVFCDICLQHSTNLCYGNITFKFTFLIHYQIKHSFQKKIVSKVRLSSFNVKENVNASTNFTVIMNIILFNLCVNRNIQYVHLDSLSHILGQESSHLVSVF